MNPRSKGQRARIDRLRAYIRDMHAKGVKRQHVAAAVGLDPTSVDYHARVLGLSFDKKGNRHA